MDPSISLSVSPDTGNDMRQLRVVAKRARLDRRGAGQAEVVDIVVTEEIDEARDERE